MSRRPHRKPRSKKGGPKEEQHTAPSPSNPAKAERPQKKKKVRYARPGEPNYLRASYHPIPEPGETWFAARTKQVAAIKAAEIEIRAQRTAIEAKRKATIDGHRARIKTTTDLINVRGNHPTPSPRADGTMPYQDYSPPQAPGRVGGKGGGEGERTAKLKARHVQIAATTHILSAAGLSLRQAFPALIPAKPYCGNDLDCGIWIWPRAKALTCLHIQYNHPAFVRWLLVDIDRRGAYLADEDALLPAFNLMMVNPANGHAHVAYVLDTPVARHDAARLAPLKLLAAVERGLTRRLGGDRGYGGLLAKNPLHPHWKVEWRRDEPYDLGTLAGWLTKEDKRPDAEFKSFGLGRNCSIFDQLRALAYREALAFKRSGGSATACRSRLTQVAKSMNGQFSEPMHLFEVQSIAKSVAKWTWRQFTEERFSAIQSKRAQIRWHGHVAESATKPWVKMGIGRRTYYRRKKSGK